MLSLADERTYILFEDRLNGLDELSMKEGLSKASTDLQILIMVSVVGSLGSAITEKWENIIKIIRRDQT